MITIKLIRLVYVIVIGLTGVTALAMLLFAWSFAEWNGALALATLVATPVVSLFQIVVTRMALEFVINQFKITEELRKIREGGKARP
jgi:membrane protein YdbS with pleckstrin-like domain